MVERAIGPPSAILGGRTVDLSLDGTPATLFIPEHWKPLDGTELWVHFHSAPWYVISEYQRAAVDTPVVIFNIGEGSTTYAKPFTKPGTFSKWISKIESELGIQVGNLNFTSFSAGYGAVRNLVADPLVLNRIGTVILGDSLYGSLDPSQPGRVVLKEHVQCWMGLVNRAIAGKSTVIMATSQITPTTYAGTWEVAQALVKNVGGKMTDVAPVAGDQRLLRNYSQGRWFVWSYAGETPMAHMTQARRLAEEIIESRK